MLRVIFSRSRKLAKAIRCLGPSIRLQSRLRRFTTPIIQWKTQRLVASWQDDVFLAYPPPEQVTGAPDTYPKLHDFYVSNKKVQWDLLKEFFRCPEVNDPPYVVRPLRHEGGMDFQVVDALPPDSMAATHYWRSLWTRSCEYRVFFIYGRKTLVLLKRVPPGTPQNIAWNAGISSFVTVADPAHDRLRHSKFYECAEKFFSRYPFHLCAVDVLYAQHKHRVVEVNFSPGVTIDNNLNVLAQALLTRNATTNSSPQAALPSGNIQAPQSSALEQPVTP